MRRTLALFVAMVAAASVFSLGIAHAEEPDGPRPTRDRPDLIAVAIGQLNETDGEKATVEFRAAKNGDRTGGSLHFYSAEHGYYNGAVRRFSVQDGVITAAGAGGLWQPDGTRIAVRFEAAFQIESKRVSIKVQGREGFEYTLEGVLDPGFIRVWTPDDSDNDEERPARPERPERPVQRQPREAAPVQ